MSANAEDEGGGWSDSVAAGKRQSDAIMGSIGDFVAQHGWTVIFLLLVWYNAKDAVRRRWRRWKNERSIASANRPERRAVLDRERTKAVAEKQAEAIEAAKALAARKRREVMEAYENSIVKED